MSAVVYGVNERSDIDSVLRFVVWTLAIVATLPLVHSTVPLVKEGVETLVVNKTMPAPAAIQSEVDALLHRMALKKSVRVKIMQRWDNAKAGWSDIVLGQRVVDALDAMCLRAIIAHELAHIKRLHLLPQVAALTGSTVGFLFLLEDERLAPFVAVVALLAMCCIAMRVVAWYCEYEADRIAACYVCPDAVCRQLEVMAKLRNINPSRDFILHPSISRRISRLGCGNGLN